MTLNDFRQHLKDGTLPDLRQKCSLCGNPLEEHPDEQHFTVGFKSKGSIRITRIPQGEAPLEIRQKWLGVVIPTVCFESQTTDRIGVVSGDSLKPASTYIVLQTKAIEALEKQDQGAADWWRSAGFPQEGNCFTFLAKEVKEVEPVSPRL